MFNCVFLGGGYFFLADNDILKLIDILLIFGLFLVGSYIITYLTAFQISLFCSFLKDYEQFLIEAKIFLFSVLRRT